MRLARDARPMIRLESITVSLPTRRRPSQVILDNISLVIEEGEWIALAGRNGSGKTTLLRTLAGLVPIQSGRIDHGPGESAHERPAVAMLLQEPDNQFVSSSVANELRLSVPPAIDDETCDRRVRGAAERFGLEDLLDRNPHRLSGGEKQRVALATVWLADPALLLLDEPTSYLDSEQSRRCVDFVTELNARGVTVVWATPGNEPTTGATRIVHLDDGRVGFDGAPADYTAFVDGRDEVDDADPLAVGGEENTPGYPLHEGAVVTLADVGFSYDTGAALDGASLAVHDGECLLVTGPNGSGKSTLLALMSGVLEPTTGTLERRYRRPVEDGRQCVFHLFQSPERLFFAETVYEEVAFGLKRLSLDDTAVAERVASALRAVGLETERFAQRSPFRLSFGEMRRLAFAIALALEPRFLLLDEPSSCLDATGCRILQRLVRRFVHRGAAVVVASHDNGPLSGIADRVVTL